MSTITKESIADTIEGLEHLANSGIQSVYIDMAIAGMRRLLASLEAEPVSFDDLRDAVAEVSGAPAMEWSDIYKGHQAVPFINFNSLARIVDKFRTTLPAPVVPDKRSPRDMEMLLDETGAEVADQDLELVLMLMSTTWNVCRHAMLAAASPREVKKCT